ncbi:Acyl-CoA N-acyltransferases (Nat) [Glarea lozoyensis ATCC 20868]|uniref:Acyl-CoA N-acyltransferases (Nat) n=1 Tax=Glarea lozoyensis (strain ATCC 20868 / MF5171) TaxID=1116229 RepID=S3CPH5_GLAL2|nr:Acyl-CoA N-acyltransferases (Nat) [Glarea lozoyensis ATCC 20868]EPE28362.1 Acyl-CoA N-acyltransferases (Nat) [Glarea lozoyensis ATCC 20868]
MAFKVELCAEADMARAFEIISEAFGHDLPYIDATFPSHPTTAGRAIGTSRLIDMMKNDPCTTFVKVVDTETGLMIAQAKWNIYKDTIPEEKDLDGDFWVNEDEKRYAQLLYRQWLIPRRKAIRESGGNLFSLDLLTVDPKYQRRGAGRLLVKWGTSQADKLGLKCVVESTDPGFGLYKSEGFEHCGVWETELPDEWKESRRKAKFVWMVREPQPGQQWLASRCLRKY